MLAFSPARRGPLPPGASREEIETAFGGWKILADEPADTSGMPRALQGSAPRWYRLTKAQPAVTTMISGNAAPDPGFGVYATDEITLTPDAYDAHLGVDLAEAG